MCSWWNAECKDWLHGRCVCNKMKDNPVIFQSSTDGRQMAEQAGDETRSHCWITPRSHLFSPHVFRTFPQPSHRHWWKKTCGKRGFARRHWYGLWQSFKSESHVKEPLLLANSTPRLELSMKWNDTKDFACSSWQIWCDWASFVGFLDSVQFTNGSGSVQWFVMATPIPSLCYR